jgi:hypothetical protein
VAGAGLDHILGLLLDLERVAEQVEDEGEVQVAEIDKVFKLGAIDHLEVVLILVAVEPGVVEGASSRIAN